MAETFTICKVIILQLIFLNVVYAHNGICLAIKRNEVLIHATTWMNSENIMIHELSQIQRNKHCKLHLYEVTEWGNSEGKVEGWLPGPEGIGI